MTVIDAELYTDLKEKIIIKEIISRCGFRCDICTAYKKNIHSPEDRQKVSDGWFKYYGFRIPPEEIFCDGCLTDDSEDIRLVSKDCTIRRCVPDKGIENCAYCDKYVCENLEKQMVDYDKIADRFKERIPDKDYECFIKPYEAKKVLDGIRKAR